MRVKHSLVYLWYIHEMLSTYIIVGITGYYDYGITDKKVANEIR